MTKLMSFVAVFSFVASASFAGGPTLVESEAMVTPIAQDDSGAVMGSFGGPLPWLIGAAVIAAVVIAADDSSSDTN